MSNKNRLKIILYEFKFSQNSSLSEYGNFRISISFNSKIISTDKININSCSKFTTGNIFNFDIPEVIDDSQSIIINSIGTSWMIFNTVICNCEINYINNLSNFNGIKRWYSMRNKEKKEVMKLLISISILEINNEKIEQENKNSVDIPLFNAKISIINNSFIATKELTSKKLNNSIINNKTKNSDSNIATKDLFNNLNKNSNSSSITPKNKINNKQYQKKNTFDKQNKENIYNKSENKFCLLTENYNNYLKDLDVDENIDINKIISLINKYEKEGGDTKIVKQFNEKINVIKIKETILEQEKRINNENSKKLKEKNKILNKERQSLENKLKRFNKEKKEFDEKNLKLMNIIKEYEYEKNKFHIKQKIDKNNKEIFYNLNYFISTGNNIPLSNPEKNTSINEKSNESLRNSSNELIDSLNLDN